MNHDVTTRRTILEIVLAAAAGLLAFVLPVALDPLAIRHDSAFLPFVRDAVEGMKPYSLGLLFAIGVMLGVLGRAPVWLTGPATVVTLPLWSMLDMSLGQDHNLFPIEWFLYGVYSTFGLVGAALGRVSRRLLSRRSTVE